MNQGDQTAAALETNSYKLLLAHVPKRCSTSVELLARLNLWHDGQFGALLAHIEEVAQDLLAVDRHPVGSSPLSRSPSSW